MYKNIMINLVKHRKENNLFPEILSKNKYLLTIKEQVFGKQII